MPNIDDDLLQQLMDMADHVPDKNELLRIDIKYGFSSMDVGQVYARRDCLFRQSDTFEKRYTSDGKLNVEALVADAEAMATDAEYTAITHWMKTDWFREQEKKYIDLVQSTASSPHLRSLVGRPVTVAKKITARADIPVVGSTGTVHHITYYVDPVDLHIHYPLIWVEFDLPVLCVGDVMVVPHSFDGALDVRALGVRAVTYWYDDNRPFAIAYKLDELSIRS